MAYFRQTSSSLGWKVTEGGGVASFSFSNARTSGDPGEAGVEGVGLTEPGSISQKRSSSRGSGKTKKGDGEYKKNKGELNPTGPPCHKTGQGATSAKTGKVNVYNMAERAIKED